MPTIQQAQRKAGAGVFAGLGEAKGDTVQLNTVEAMLGLYAMEFIGKAQKNLKQANKISTGGLSESMRFESTEMPGGLSLKIFVNDYYKFVDEGVQGAGPKSKNRTSPYKYRDKMPPIVEIMKWMRTNVNAAAIDDQRTKLSKLQKKRKRLKETVKRADSIRKVAFMFAKSIQMKGFKKTGFWSRAFDESFKDFGPKMAEAMGADIRIDLKNMIKEVKK
jgi:uncharacterized iron-regulated protein